MVSRAGDVAATAVGHEGDYPSLTAASYTLSLLFVAYIFSFIDRQILALLVGPIREDFGITDFQYSLLQGAAFALLYTFTGLPIGRLADRHSRKLILFASVSFWSLATVACGLTRNFAQLFAARMAVGAGEAGLAPPAYSIILDSFRERHVGYAMSIYKLAVKVGGGLALIIGGVLYDYYAGLGALALPLVGEIRPWQATLITVGAPGLIIGALMLTIAEPSRKGMAEQRDAGQVPVRDVAAYVWKRRRLYLSLFFGSSMMAMAGYGAAAWYPEFFTRTYGFSKTEAGTWFGSIVMVGGGLGVFFGAWLANLLASRGHADAYVRAMVITALAAVIPATAAPLAGNVTLTLLLLGPATLLSGSYLGVMAVSFVVISPNQLRGQLTAVYIFVTNILGMAVGTSILAAFTDFLYQDDGLLHYSIATAVAIFYPSAALLFWFCLPAYRQAAAETGSWRL
jgi:MFS family permease